MTRLKQVLSVLNWILIGILILIGTITLFSTLILSGLSLIAAAVLLVPAVTRMLKQRFGFNFHAPMKTTFVVVLLIIFIIGLPKNNSDSSHPGTGVSTPIAHCTFSSVICDIKLSRDKQNGLILNATTALPVRTHLQACIHQQKVNTEAKMIVTQDGTLSAGPFFDDRKPFTGELEISIETRATNFWQPDAKALEQLKASWNQIPKGLLSDEKSLLGTDSVLKVASKLTAPPLLAIELSAEEKFRDLTISNIGGMPEGWESLSVDELKDGKSYRFTIVYRKTPKSLAQIRADTGGIVRAIIQIIMSEGKKPAQEMIGIYVHAQQPAGVGETGQPLSRDYGKSSYDFSTDQIEFEGPKKY